MNMKIIAAIVVAAVVVASVAYVVLSGDEGSDDGKITFYGAEYSWDELESEFGTKTLGNFTGVSLSAVLNATDFGVLPSDAQNETLFQITADDGWQKNVSWHDLQSGILVEEERMTYFPQLPGAYKVKNVESIDDIEIGPIAIVKAGASWAECAEVTWNELIAEVNVTTFTSSNFDYQGVKIADALEYAGISGYENRTLTFEGVDGYTRTVTWAAVLNGYLVEDGYRCMFVDLPNSYRVRNVIRITVN